MKKHRKKRQNISDLFEKEKIKKFLTNKIK